MNAWVDDLTARVVFLLSFDLQTIATVKLSTFNFQIGLMFTPEAFIIAVRQMTAQENKWSLEDLELYLDVTGSLLPGLPQDVTVAGLTVQGASWVNDSHLAFSDDLRHALPACKIKWRPRGMQPKAAAVTAIPVYVNESRKTLVSQVLMSTLAGVSASLWAQRGVAIILQTPML